MDTEAKTAKRFEIRASPHAVNVLAGTLANHYTHQQRAQAEHLAAAAVSAEREEGDG